MSPDIARYTQFGRFRSYEKGPDSVGSYAPSVLEKLMPYVTRLTPNPVIVDNGAGPGYISEWLRVSGCTVIAVDPSEDALTHTLAIPVRGTLADAGIRSSSVHAIHVKDTLEHIRDKDEFMQTCSSILVPGGYVLFTFVETPWLSAMFDGWTGVRDNYETTTLDVIKTASRNGIGTVCTWSWEPGPDEKDWYPYPTPRVVMLGRK